MYDETILAKRIARAKTKSEQNDYAEYLVIDIEVREGYRALQVIPADSWQYDEVQCFDPRIVYSTCD